MPLRESEKNRTKLSTTYLLRRARLEKDLVYLLKRMLSVDKQSAADKKVSY